MTLDNLVICIVTHFGWAVLARGTNKGWHRRSEDRPWQTKHYVCIFILSLIVYHRILGVEKKNKTLFLIFPKTSAKARMPTEFPDTCAPVICTEES